MPYARRGESFFADANAGFLASAAPKPTGACGAARAVGTAAGGCDLERGEVLRPDIGDAQVPRHLVELGEHACQRLGFHRRAVMAGTAKARHAPSLDGARDHRERPLILRDAERTFDRRRIVAVDDFGPRTERCRLRREMLPVLRRRDIVALAQRVAVEDGDHPAEAVIGAEIQRFPDLSFARLAVADETEDALRHAVNPRRAREPRRHR